MDAKLREQRTGGKLRMLTRELRSAGFWHWFPLLWIDLASIEYFYAQIGDNDPSHVMLIALLMVVHADLYLLGTRTALRRHYLLYLLVQSLLLIPISLLAHNWYVTLGLYMALVIRAAELLEQAKPGPGQVLSFVALQTPGLSLMLFQYDSDDSVNWISLLPFLICSGSYAFLYVRQSRASQRLQRLVRDLETANHELCATHTKLAAEHAQLAASIVEIEENTLMEERQRFARELHDTLAQGLVSLVWQLEAADSYLTEEQSRRAREIVQQAAQQARTALAETRTIIHDLRSEAVGQGSFVEVVRAEMRCFSQVTGIACRGDLRQFAALPAVFHELVLQAIKEGLTNVARHAHAHEVWLSVRNSGSAFHLEIRDDGRGFIPRPVVAGHYGLLGLSERVRQLGGELEVWSAPGEGTRVKMSLPHTQEAQTELCV